MFRLSNGVSIGTLTRHYSGPWQVTTHLPGAFLFFSQRFNRLPPADILSAGGSFFVYLEVTGYEAS